jgi:hypothetical protein
VDGKVSGGALNGEDATDALWLFIGFGEDATDGLGPWRRFGLEARAIALVFL